MNNIISKSETNKSDVIKKKKTEDKKQHKITRITVSHFIVDPNSVLKFWLALFPEIKLKVVFSCVIS